MNHFILKKSIVLILAIFLFTSCSSDDGDDEPGSNTPEFAMTYTLNGEMFEVNNPFGTNEFSENNIYNVYPIEDYVLLQSRNGLFGTVEIDLWLKRDQIIAGTTYIVNYSTDAETDDGGSTHIDLIDNRNSTSELTSSGEVSIVSVDTVNKIVTGTFQFVATASFDPNDIVSTITDGTFNYVYE